MAKPIEVTDDTFEATVINSDKPVLVDFWATWCPPCKMIAPYIEEMAGEYEGSAKICKVDVDNSQQVAQKYGIRSIPTLLFFKGGEVKDQVVGAQPKEQLKARLDNLING